MRTFTSQAAKTITPAPVAGTYLQRKCACGGGSGGGSGSCSECEKAKRLRRLPSGVSHASAGGVPAAVTRTLSSTGQPLDAASRVYFEPRLGHDFSRVRVHTDSQAEEAAASVGARAFTVGRHVVFGRGEYSPSEAAGRHVLAHELTHVVQQDSAEPAARIEIGEPDDALEREADEVARSVVTESAGESARAAPDASGGPVKLRRLGANPDCTREQRDAIHQAIFDANSWAVKAVRQLDERPVSARVLGALRRNFGPTYGVVENIEMIRNRLDTGRRAMLRIPYSCDGANTTRLCAASHCGWATVGSNEATICGVTFPIGGNLLRRCVLHEAHHATMAFMTADVYQDNPDYPGNDTEPLLNPQSYVLLAANLS